MEIRKPWLWDNERAREMSARGNLARQLFTTPERRKYIARKAAAARWYRPTYEPIERIECYLRLFKNLVAQAIVENQPDKIARYLAGMQGYERMKIALEAERMKDVTPEVDPELTDRLRRYAERRRNAFPDATSEH